MSVTQLVETRWRRFGNDRVYVKSADGHDLGHVDLIKRTVSPAAPEHEDELRRCLARWTAWLAPSTDIERVASPAVGEPPPEADTAAPTEPAAPDTTDAAATAAPPGAPSAGSLSDAPARDLAANVAGAAARAKRNEVNAQAPVLNLVARVLGVKTEERAWRIGAKGEEKVAHQLSKLGPRWRVLHAVEVGHNGSDIDHVVIGPPGVFTLNAKRHPGGKAWVGERMVMVNGQKTAYLRNARFEAQRAERLLSAACERSITVTPAVVFVDLDQFDVKQMPQDVHVTTRLRLLAWLRSLPVVLDTTTIDGVYANARRSTTWM